MKRLIVWITLLVLEEEKGTDLGTDLFFLL